MSIRNVIRQLIENQQVESVLTRGSGHKDDVRALQTMLYKLGFGKELNWEKFGADGGYGGSTVNAAAAFAKKNQLPDPGDSISAECAQKLSERFDILDDMQYLARLIKKGIVEERLYKGSSDKPGVTALQTLLNELGYGAALNWEKFGADGGYGASTDEAVQVFAQNENLTAPVNKLSNELAQRIIEKLEGFFGEDWNKEEAPPAPTATTSGNLTIREVVERNRPRVYVSDGADEVRFTQFKKGVWTLGKQQTIEAVNNNKAGLNRMGLNDSALNVMIAVSENEGNLDAINTWDNSFMTFGMFQWTVGAGGDPGELAALLVKIKTADPELYDKYYGQYGLDVQATSKIAGYFSLNGAKLKSPADKEKLRTNEWAYYFWKSGQDKFIQSMQIQHAHSRLNTFYSSNSYKPNGFFISELVTSEYGIGLILDNHVNRPGYIKGCLEEAMKNANLFDPANWGTEEEMKLIEEYIKVRADYGRSPMTDANKRASVTKKYLDNNTISADRGSFQHS
jgi:peptidoglycan hydrolase-like protein with peptidoglycan-binding domain